MFTKIRVWLAAILLTMSLNANAALIEGNLQTAGDGFITLDTATGLEWLDFDLNRMRGDRYGNDAETVADTMARVMTGTYATEYGFRIATAAEVATLFQHAHFLDAPSIIFQQPDVGFVTDTWSNTVMLGADESCWSTQGFQIEGCEWQVKGLHVGAIAGEWQYSQFDCGAFTEPASPSNQYYYDSCPQGGAGYPSIYSLGNTVSPDQLSTSLIDEPPCCGYREYSDFDTPGVFMVRATVVPLPAAVWFFTTGLGMLGGMGWSRKRNGAA